MFRIVAAVRISVSCNSKALQSKRWGIEIAGFRTFCAAIHPPTQHSHTSSAPSPSLPAAPTAKAPSTTATSQAEGIVEVKYDALVRMTPEALQLLKKAFVGPKAFGAVAVTDIPGYGERRARAFRAGIDLALLDSDGRKRAAAVNNTYPGWSGTPGEETHPLQSSFLFNIQEVAHSRPDPYFGKNIFPSEAFRGAFEGLALPMREAALQVLRGCDHLMDESMRKEGLEWSADGRSLHRLGDVGPALAGRFICYDSGFTREDKLLDQRPEGESVTELEKDVEDVRLVANTSSDTSSAAPKSAGHAGDGLASMRTHSTPVKSAGHAGDGLASMRTHSTPVKSAGHAGDGLASMRTHSTPVKSAGHAGDGLASMRTHSTPVKSAGHAGDGLASMRTHSTPVKSAGHAGDGLASMRTHSTPVKSAGHAGDGLASMRTHSTPVKSAGHAGDGLASMRTHSTPVKSAGHAGDGLASMRTHSTPVKSAGHAGDGLASMRTHSTPVKSAGHAGDGLASMRTHSTPVKSAGHAGDGLASMRTHSTPVKSAGHAGDGLASMRTHSTPVKSAGKMGGLEQAGEQKSSKDAASGAIRPMSATNPLGNMVSGYACASARPILTPADHAGDAATPMHSESMHVKDVAQAVSVRVPGQADGLLSTHMSSAPLKPFANSVDVPASARAHATIAHLPEAGGDRHTDGELEPPRQVAEAEAEFGDYWLPWHIDSNFVTLIHKEMYAHESDASLASEPDNAGVLFMNQVGDVVKLEDKDDAFVLQMGAFAQIYTGGVLTACRHAVLNPRPAGISRFNFCNFWYAPWHTMCDPPAGFETRAVNKGWNAMMDESYIGITMKQGFAAFRDFMTSPEARVQFADSVRFKELAELIPLPPKQGHQRQRVAQVVVDVATDVRCPFSHLSQTNLEKALENLGLSEQAVVRYHPVFLNPNVPAEGESLDDYLWREYGYSKEFAHSENYPLRMAGLRAGIQFNPNRRVVNTFDAFCLIEAAEAAGKQRELVKELSDRYFENAEDISQEGVLAAAAAKVGLGDGDFVRRTLQDLSIRNRVQQKYHDLSEKLSEVPHFVVRERISGNGVEVGGNRSVEEWEGVLGAVLERGRFLGMAISGPHGKQVWLPEANPNAPVSMAHRAQHSWEPEYWPFTAEDFSRMDESADSGMYAEPRFVNHLDDQSLERLTSAYAAAFQTAPTGFTVLDLCSSWTSHYPRGIMAGASRVAVHGLNAKELEANDVATERHVQDLNANPALPWEDNAFDFATLALSVQYLTDPRAVFAEMHRVLKPGGMAIIAFSHRSFIEKAVNCWAKEPYDGEGHAHLICRYFQHGPQKGWAQLASVDVSPRHADPVWLVTAVKRTTA